MEYALTERNSLEEEGRRKIEGILKFVLIFFFF